MKQPVFHHHCRMCGARSYRPVISRDNGGAMRPSGVFQCSGCSRVFSDPKEWHLRGRQVLLPTPMVSARRADGEHASPGLIDSSAGS